MTSSRAHSVTSGLNSFEDDLGHHSLPLALGVTTLGTPLSFHISMISLGLFAHVEMGKITSSGDGLNCVPRTLRKFIC